MMTPQEYKSRLYSTLSRVEGILEATGMKAETDSLKETLASALEQETSESEANAQLNEIKTSLINILRQALDATQIAFVEIEEPDNSDAELFKKYLLELKEYRQVLSSPSSETRKKINSLLRRSKNNLLNELQSQAIIFPSECLDTILACPEVEQENGANWVVEQINEALNTLLKEVNIRLGAAFDAVNEVLGSDIDALETNYTQAINLGRQSSSSMSDDMFGFARQALPSIGIGSIGYGAAAFLLGPIAGVVAGLAAGGMFIWKSQSFANKQKKIMELKQQLSPKITLAMNELRTYVAEKYDEFEESLTASIETMNEAITQEMQDCMDALKSCEMDSKDFELQQVQYSNRMTALETHIKQLEILNTNPFEQNNK